MWPNGGLLLLSLYGVTQKSELELYYLRCGVTRIQIQYVLNHLKWDRGGKAFTTMAFVELFVSQGTLSL